MTERLSSLVDQEEPPEQQQLPVIALCWDPLFSFLTRFFKPLRPRRPVVILQNLEAETATNYKQLLSWEIPADYEGILNEISLYTSRGSASQWVVTIAGQEILKDKKIHTSLTLPWKELPLIAGIKVLIQVKTTDGVATDFDACLTGELRYLARR